MPQSQLTLDLLTAMITPAVLISACGTLIFSTSTRLARIVDRVRELTNAMDTLYAGAEGDFLEERRAEVERQLSMHARRGRLIQWSLTSYGCCSSCCARGRSRCSRPGTCGRPWR